MRSLLIFVGKILCYNGIDEIPKVPYVFHSNKTDVLTPPSLPYKADVYHRVLNSRNPVPVINKCTASEVVAETLARVFRARITP